MFGDSHPGRRATCALGLLLCAACTAAEPVYERHAITNGTLEADYPAVVALVVESGDPVCTGTLIAPHTILSAGHCVAGLPEGTPLRAFFGSSVTGSGTHIEVSASALHPGYAPATLQNDLGLFTLRNPAPVAPIPLDPRTLDASAVGQTFLAVGFGATSPTASDAGEKRSGTSIVSEVTAQELTATPGPSQACSSDSGGPALFDISGTSHVTGVVSRGDLACADHAVYALVAAARESFIDPYLTATAAGSADTGERCFNDAQCAAGPCIQATDDERLYYCSASCSTDGDCPSPMCCSGMTCTYPGPTPGALGASCSDVGDCIDDICYIAPGAESGVCATDCRTNMGVCPDGYACEHTGGIAFYCLPIPNDDGCSSSKGGGAWWPILLALLLAPARRRSTPHSFNN